VGKRTGCTLSCQSALWSSCRKGNDWTKFTKTKRRNGKSVVSGVTGFEGSSGLKGSPNRDRAVGDERLFISDSISLDNRSFFR